MRLWSVSKYVQTTNYDIQIDTSARDRPWHRWQESEIGDSRLQSGPIVLLLTAFCGSLWLSCDPDTCGVAWWRRCWAHLAGMAGTQLQGVRRKLAIDSIDGHLWASFIAFLFWCFLPFLVTDMFLQAPPPKRQKDGEELAGERRRNRPWKCTVARQIRPKFSHYTH